MANASPAPFAFSRTTRRHFPIGLSVGLMVGGMATFFLLGCGLWSVLFIAMEPVATLPVTPLPAYDSATRSLLLSLREQGNATIYRFDGNGNRQQLTSSSADDHSPLWVEPPNRYAFVRLESGTATLMLGDLAGGDAAGCWTMSGAWELEGIAPDGRQAVITRIYWAGGKGNGWEVRLIDLPGGEFGEIILPAVPRFSPDSARLVYSGPGGVVVATRRGDVLARHAEGDEACFLDNSTYAYSTSTGQPVLHVRTIEGQHEVIPAPEGIDLDRLVAWGTSGCLFRQRSGEYARYIHDRRLITKSSTFRDDHAPLHRTAEFVIVKTEDTNGRWFLIYRLRDEQLIDRIPVSRPLGDSRGQPAAPFFLPEPPAADDPR